MRRGRGTADIHRAGQGWQDPELTPESLLANWSSADQIGDWEVITGGSTENFDKYFGHLLETRNPT